MTKKPHRQTRLLLFSLLVVPHILYADVGDWKTFTSSKDIRQMVADDSLIWCATEGGVLVYNYTHTTFRKYTNTEGLSSIDVVAIERDHRGSIWVGLADGRLNIMDAVSGKWSMKNDYRGLTINDLCAYGDSVFVALNIGVSLYDAKRQEVKETYKIGESRQVFINGRDIWVAQKDGVRQASLDFPNLMAPSAWSRYTKSANGLPNDDALALSRFDSRIVVGTKSGLSFFDGNAWSTPELTDREIRNFAVWQGSLVVASSFGVFRRESSGTWTPIGSLIENAYNLVAPSEGGIWIGLRGNALARLNEGDSTWEFRAPNDPVGNRVSALAFDHHGVLWAGFSAGGLSRFDGRTWTNFSKADGMDLADGIRCIAVDNRNRIWVGTWGGGINVLEQNDDSVRISLINSSDGRLAGVEAGASYVVVTGLHLDSEGNMWILNREAANKRVLAVSSPENEWQYFSTLEGIPTDLVTALEIDLSGRKWIGTDNSGLSVLDDNNTPFDKSDDDFSGRLNTNDGLESNNVRAIAADMDGLVWIGTPEGLDYWYEGEVKPRYEVINDDINCIMVDVRNNKWIGTSGGLSKLDADGFTWEHYSTSNSPLISDNVTSFAFNENTGEVYIGTTNGISRLETAYTRPAQNLNFVAGHPNPFVLSQTGARFVIENLAEKATVRFYTPEGFLVRHISSNEILGSRATWNGANDRGDLVASGIYIYVVTTEDGLSRTGKVAVINP